ncbi:hypothetical protein KM043_001344 [Ampulex compressa]|nr:hypothetical protein KM043_001344 [Ampulex compressa]
MGSLGRDVTGREKKEDGARSLEKGDRTSSTRRMPAPREGSGAKRIEALGKHDSRRTIEKRVAKVGRTLAEDPRNAVKLEVGRPGRSTFLVQRYEHSPRLLEDRASARSASDPCLFDGPCASGPSTDRGA